nr:VOC family protein [Agrobacterium sp. SORGH_AS_0745]
MRLNSAAGRFRFQAVSPTQRRSQPTCSGTFHFSVQVPIDGKPATVGNGTHIAFVVEGRSMVDRFYAAALKYGGSDDGAQPDYDVNYYAAFVRDPDGHKIEAVTYSAK